MGGHDLWFVRGLEPTPPSDQPGPLRDLLLRGTRGLTPMVVAHPPSVEGFTPFVLQQACILKWLV